MHSTLNKSITTYCVFIIFELSRDNSIFINLFDEFANTNHFSLSSVKVISMKLFLKLNMAEACYITLLQH